MAIGRVLPRDLKGVLLTVMTILLSMRCMMQEARCCRKVPVVLLACSFRLPERYGTVPERERDEGGSEKDHGPKV